MCVTKLENFTEGQEIARRIGISFGLYGCSAIVLTKTLFNKIPYFIFAYLL